MPSSRTTMLILAALLAGCGSTPPGSAGPADAGAGDSGVESDAGSSDAGSGDAGSGDAGVVEQGTWTWVPVDGSKCASGARAGIAVNESTASDDLVVFMQGGGACWDQGTCVPSLLRFGPICYYNSNFCLYDGEGGTKPIASHVTHPDPYPADGGGVFPNDLKMLLGMRAFDRADAANPFRDATFVFVPYCTGDLHSGDAVRTYAYRHDLIGLDRQYTFHFAGSTNVQRYLERLTAMRPGAKHVWLTGASAGGYGATLNFERVQKAFPDAEVSLLADSAPFVDAPLHWQQWRDTWNMQLPEGCTTCRDGFPNILEHLAKTYSNRRLGLLAFEEDKVIAWFMYGGTGPEAALNPPTGAYNQKLLELGPLYSAHPNLGRFLLPGGEHVMWGGYGTRRSDGTWTEPWKSADGKTDLKKWIDAWATGSPEWKSVP